uniref:hypothetical protein n=1 Tax=Halomonas sp. TaxID=1486246 RepID=UPI00260A9010|nr:hypothetical protein [Halomonas sp.]
MKRVYTSLSLLALASPAYAEVSDKVPGYLSMVLWPLGVVVLLVIGKVTGWRALNILAVVLSAFWLWAWWDFVWVDDIYPTAVRELGDGYAVTVCAQLGVWALLLVVSLWQCVKRRG